MNEVLTEKMLMPTNDFDMLQQSALEYPQKRNDVGKININIYR